MNVYKLEWENGLTVIIRSRSSLVDLKPHINQEGLRSIAQIK